jgi:hypothetical protein
MPTLRFGEKETKQHFFAAAQAEIQIFARHYDLQNKFHSFSG